MKRYLRVIGSECISHVAILEKSFPGKGNRQCKGPEVGERTSREAQKTGLEPHGGYTVGNKVSDFENKTV